jgi:hypothetical protein
MKRTMIMAVVVFVVAAGLYYVFAAKQNEGGMMGSGMMQGRTMDSNDMMKNKMWQNREMMDRRNMMGMYPMGGMMGGSSLIATSDGGVVVLMGNKLIKYDKDLNLVKEVEIKIDWETMNKTMTEHHKMMMGASSGTENK